MKTLFKNGTLILGDGTRINNGYLLVEDGQIKEISLSPIEDHDEVIDLNKNYLCPALIDSHTHGVGGYDFNDLESFYHFDEIADKEYQEGVGSIFLSLVPEETKVLNNLLAYYDQLHSPIFQGIHLEGPFLNINNKAVMKEEYLHDPDPDEFKEFTDITDKIVSMTVAPELEGSLSLVAIARENNIRLNIGHSSATASEVLKYDQLGFTGITHLYNAMSQHLHRDPGIVTGAFISNSIMCELVVDGFHVHPDIIKATYKILGRERIILISDANPFKGIKEGDYIFSGKNVHVDDDSAVVIETGRIAGSTLRLDKACQNMMAYCDCTIDDVIMMASYNPGQYYHLNKGYLHEGYDADLLIVDKDFKVISLFKDDRFVYQNQR